ncbi:MAG: hypothetical protein ABR585_01345 [Gemmatimonadaceae bacterium]
MQATSPTTQTGAPGSAVSAPPSVIVLDQNGTGLEGVTVTFTVTSGGGSVSEGSVVTDAQGQATVGAWTLGTAGGTNTLDASVRALPPVTFTASGNNACVVSDTHTIGAATNGALTTSDCQFSDGSYIDYVRTSVATGGTYLFNMSSDAFDAVLFLYLAGGHIIGYNDDFTGKNSTIKALLPPGLFDLGANAYDPDTTGNYTLTSTATTDQVTNCEDVFVWKGISSNQSLQTTDCRFGGYDDDYIIFLAAGESITVSMNSAAIDSRLEVYEYGGSLLTANENRDDTTRDARLTFTAPASGRYVIAATTSVAGATGDYTIIIE